MLDVLYLVFIFPFAWAMALVFDSALAATGSPGLAIAAIAVVVNIVLLPMHYFVERRRAEDQAMAARLAPFIEEIEAVYAGQERHYLLRTLYRQHGFRPGRALQSSLGLLIQIPLFVAAFGYLWSLDALQGVAFGLFTNLGQPDGAVQFAGVEIHVMPFVMTLVNLIGVYRYTGRSGAGEKYSLYALAAVFLIALYPAPVGLVLYWTLNNVIALVRQWLYRQTT